MAEEPVIQKAIDALDEVLSKHGDRLLLRDMMALSSVQNSLRQIQRAGLI